jgi:hypothetical protein
MSQIRMLTIEKIYNLRHRSVFWFDKKFSKYTFKINNKTQNIN